MMAQYKMVHSNNNVYFCLIKSDANPPYYSEYKKYIDYYMDNINDFFKILSNNLALSLFEELK